MNAINTKVVSEKKQALWNTLGLTAILAGNYLILIFLLRMEAFSDAGIFSLCLAVVAIFQEIAACNVRTFQIADNYTRFSESAYIFARFFSILISFICYFIFLLYIRYDWKTVLSMTLFLLSQNIGIFFDVFTTKIQIQKRLDILGKGYLLSSLCSVIVFITTYFFYQNIVFAFLARMLFSIIFSIMFTFFSYRKIIGLFFLNRIEYKKTHIKSACSLLKVCFPLFVSVLLVPLLSAFPKILLERYTDIDVVGILAALSTPAVLVPTVAASFFAPYILRFTDLFGKGKYLTILKNIFRIALLIFGGCTLALLLNSVVGLKIFQLVYGNKITDYFPFFTPILIAYFILAFSTIITTILIIADRRKFILLSSIIVTIISYILSAYLIKNLALYGACLSILLTNLLQAIILSCGLLKACNIIKGLGNNV